MTKKCFATTNGFWVSPQGYVYPCAKIKQPYKKIHISDIDDYSKINQNFTDIKESLSKNIWHSACERCEFDEKNKIRSKRQYYDVIQPLSYIIDISLGNYCNLKCRMCNPTNSTTWKEDWAPLQEEGKRLGVKLSSLYDDSSNYVFSNKDVKKLIEFTNTINGDILLELKGGEPLLMPQTFEILNQLNNKNISLLLVTNGTKYPSWIEKISEKFKQIELIVSVDGVGETYEYIRGFSYDKLIQNLEKFSKLSNMILGFNVVVQNLNICQIELIHKTLSMYSQNINYITLKGPEILRANVLPSREKNKVLTEYCKNKKIYGKKQSQIESIMNFVKQPSDPKLLDLFFKYNSFLDKRRNQCGIIKPLNG